MNDSIRFTILAIVLIAGTASLPFVRKRRWAPALWISVIALDFELLFSIFGILPKNTGGGPDAGFVGMAAGFYLALSLPIIAAAIVSLILAFIFWPRREAWNIPGALGGVAGAVAFGFLLSEHTAPRVAVRVVDENGQPAPNVSVAFSSYQLGARTPLGIVSTDDKGEARKGISHKEWSASVTARDGTRAILGVDIGPQGKAHVILSWNNPNWGKHTPVLVIDSPMGKEREFELRLHKADQVVDPWVAGELHRQLEDVLNGRLDPAAIKDVWQDLEIFDELPLLAQIAQRTGNGSRCVADILNEMGTVLASFRGGLLKKEGKRDDSSVWPRPYEVLCQWMKVSPEEDVKTAAPILHQKLQEQADAILATAEPLWKTEGPVAIDSLGKLGQPAFPKLLEFAAAADSRSERVFWNVVRTSNPDVSVAKPYFNNADDRIAAGAIYSVCRKLNPVDSAEAAGIVQRIIDNGNSSVNRQYLDEMMRNLKERQNTQ